MQIVSMLIKPSSSACNMRCKYCFYKDVVMHRGQDDYGFMSEKVQKIMLERAFSCAKRSITFAFQGGEPTLIGLDYYRRHVRLCRELNRNGIAVNNTIQTNGILINSEWARFFAENNFLVGLSLDGPQNVHDRWRIDGAGKGTFVSVCRAAAELERHGVQFNILSVVTSAFVGNVSKAFAFFERNGFRYLQFIPCIDPFGCTSPREYSLSPELYGRFLIAAFRKYYAAFKKMQPFSIRMFDNYVRILAGETPESCDMNGYCSANFVVEADGGVYPCDFYVLDDHCIGNITCSGLPEMMQSSAVKKFIKPSLYIAEKCRSCRWYFLCRGGCRRLREEADGQISVNRFCESYTVFFEKCYQGLKEIAERYIAFGRSV